MTALLLFTLQGNFKINNNFSFEGAKPENISQPAKLGFSPWQPPVFQLKRDLSDNWVSLILFNGGEFYTFAH